MQKKRIIYIAGLGHSGSTILDLILGSNSQIIGLGEIMAYVKRKNKDIDLKSTCSCGKTGYNCSFWGNTLKIIENTKNNDETYFKIVNYFFEHYNNDTILVDSSKNSYDYLKKLNVEYDLKIIFLTRDFRSWSYSRHLSTKKNIFINILRWYGENIKLLAKIKSMNLEFLNVGYEELALYPKFTLKKICNYIEVDFENQMLNPSNTKSHIIAGNVVRADKEKRSQITYDSRWMTSTRIILNSLLFIPFFRFNKKLVYKNLLGKNLKVENFHIFNSKERKQAEDKYN